MKERLKLEQILEKLKPDTFAYWILPEEEPEMLAKVVKYTRPMFSDYTVLLLDARQIGTSRGTGRMKIFLRWLANRAIPEEMDVEDISDIIAVEYTNIVLFIDYGELLTTGDLEWLNGDDYPSPITILVVRDEQMFNKKVLKRSIGAIDGKN